MERFLDGLKLINKVNLVFYIAMSLIIVLIITFNVTSNLISKSLEKNYTNYSQVNQYTAKINDNLKMLDYVTIKNSLVESEEFFVDSEKIYEQIITNLNLLVEHEFFIDSKKNLELIDKIKSRIVGYKTITDTLKSEVDISYEDGMYAVLALSTTSNIISKELTILSDRIYALSQDKIKELNELVFTIRVVISLIVILMFLLMVYLNKKVSKTILSKLDRLKLGVSSFFEFLAKDRKDVIHPTYTSDDEISQIGKIIDSHMYIAENMLLRERQETLIIEERVKNATKEILELNEELEDTQREIVFTMGAVAEKRSKETGNHVKRVAKYSQILSRLYGLDAEESLLLKNASPMHDVGKIGIPDHILNKPAKLTPDEFEVMKEHAEIGYQMLSHSNKSILRAAAIVAYEHHEKYDGSGYPRGLKGEEIHIYGRITAIADVFDALGSDRVYKKAWSIEKIVEYFKEQKAKQFDPVLVDLFLDNLDYFLKAKEKIDGEEDSMSFEDYIEGFEELDDIKAS